MTTLTPDAHARLSPSGAKRWFACPGSLTLAAGFPDKPNEFSDDGTAMHDVAAQCLVDSKQAAAFIGTWITVSRAGETPVRKVQFDDDMAELTQGYVDYVRAKAVGNELHVEQRLSFSKFIGVPDQFGTTDAGIVNWDQGELDVQDLKTGHKPVKVEGNEQLMIYGLAMLGELYEQAQRKAPGDDDEFA